MICLSRSHSFLSVPFRSIQLKKRFFFSATYHFGLASRSTFSLSDATEVKWCNFFYEIFLAKPLNWLRVGGNSNQSGVHLIGNLIEFGLPASEFFSGKFSDEEVTLR